ncbi:MAG: fused MFS/spermidine synthase [Pseudomonadota bacterium]
MTGAVLRNAVLCGLLFCEGFVLMGFEMVSSRFMSPYFGSSIETWACIISVVLCSMALGYFTGGYLAGSRRAKTALIVATLLAALYLFVLSVIAHNTLGWMIESVEFSVYLTLLAAVFILAIPVYLMSFWSPIAVGLWHHGDTNRPPVAGYVYGISTVGNVFGTLSTAFYLVPNFGSSTITFYMALALVGIVVIFALLNASIKANTVGVISCVALGIGLTIPPPVTAAPNTRLDLPANYPEGVYISPSNQIYFTDMDRDSVYRVIEGRAAVFASLPSCGPTGFTTFNDDHYAVACHKSGEVLILNAEGRVESTLNGSAFGFRFRNPNDINFDANGGVYFSDPGPFSPRAQPVGKVFHIASDKTVSLVAEGLRYPNGLAFNAETGALLVSEHLGKRILSIALDQPPRPKGSIQEVFDFTDLEIEGLLDPLSGPDGLRLLPDGAVLVALYGTATIVQLGPCGRVTLTDGFPKFVTSLGIQNKRIVAVGAFFNNRSPAQGQLIALSETIQNPC